MLQFLCLLYTFFVLQWCNLWEMRWKGQRTALMFWSAWCSASLRNFNLYSYRFSGLFSLQLDDWTRRVAHEGVSCGFCLWHTRPVQWSQLVSTSRPRNFRLYLKRGLRRMSPSNLSWLAAKLWSCHQTPGVCIQLLGLKCCPILRVRYVDRINSKDLPERSFNTRQTQWIAAGCSCSSGHRHSVPYWISTRNSRSHHYNPTSEGVERGSACIQALLPLQQLKDQAANKRSKNQLSDQDYWLSLVTAHHN